MEYPFPGSFSGIAAVTAGWDGNIWFTEKDTEHVGAITTTGTVLPTYDTSARPLRAGSYRYGVADARGNKRRLDRNPRDAAFLVHRGPALACHVGNAPQAPNLVFDVLVDDPSVPGGFTLWQTTTTLSGNYTPASTGRYRFIARLRNTSTAAASDYSPVVSIPIQ